jgi:hypothetical protein
MPRNGAMALVLFALCAARVAAPPPNEQLPVFMRQLQARTTPNSRCFMVPDWASECAVPTFDKAACIQNNGLATNADLLQTGYYFDQHTCTCVQAKYIDVQCGVSQTTPTFTSVADCEVVCYKPSTGCDASLGNSMAEGCCCDGSGPAQCYMPAAFPGQLLQQRHVLRSTVEGALCPSTVQSCPTGRDCSAPVKSPCGEAYMVDALSDELKADLELKGKFCQTPFCTGSVFLLNLFILLMCFLALAIICDDFLVPPIEHFCETYSIPDEAAGASFLAFGSSAPGERAFPDTTPPCKNTRCGYMAFLTGRCVWERPR